MAHGRLQSVAGRRGGRRPPPARPHACQALALAGRCPGFRRTEEEEELLQPECQCHTARHGAARRSVARVAWLPGPGLRDASGHQPLGLMITCLRARPTRGARTRGHEPYVSGHSGAWTPCSGCRSASPFHLLPPYVSTSTARFPLLLPPTHHGGSSRLSLVRNDQDLGCPSMSCKLLECAMLTLIHG